MSLKDKNIEYADKLSLKKNYPAVSITAVLDGNYYSDHSRPCDPCIPQKLRKKLKELGNLYSDNGINIIGKCAEINVAHKVLEVDDSISLNGICFSDPIRPRTKQKINTCGNCLKTFN